MSLKKLPPVQIEVRMRNPETGRTWRLTGWAENEHTKIYQDYDDLPFTGPHRVKHEWVKYQFKIIGDHNIVINEKTDLP